MIARGKQSMFPKPTFWRWARKGFSLSSLLSRSAWGPGPVRDWKWVAASSIAGRSGCLWAHPED
jgi:hypothetical protein